MTKRYQLEQLAPGEVARWDELIAPYDSRELFHSRVWLDYLAESRQLDIHFWALRTGSTVEGYFCGGILRKGPFRILGSPLKGWGTNFLGPVVNRDFDRTAFLLALDDLAEREKFAMVEVENPLLGTESMQAAGYEPVSQPTYITPITPGDTETMWRRIHLKARQKIKKAERAGLTVEETNDASVVNEFFDEFVEDLSRKQLFPPYGRECPRLLFEHLKPHGLLLALHVSGPGGKTIATGLFPHDDQTIYFWGGASRLNSWKYAPNDLLQWWLMKWAAEKGLSVYNMCGYGHFKSKFGGTLEKPIRWHKCYSQAAHWARRAYEFYFGKLTRLRGWREHASRRQGGG